MPKTMRVAALLIWMAWPDPGRAQQQGTEQQNAQLAEEHSGIVGDIDSNDQLHWTHISCPAGQSAAGIAERQGGWTAQISLLCTSPNLLGGWSAQPVSAGTAGGNYGNHGTTLLCTKNEWITGMSGEMATAYYAGLSGEQARRFLADPVIYCGNASNPALSSYADTKFSPEKPSGLYPTTYAQIPQQHCPPGDALIDLEVAVETTHHPDIKAARLGCAASPAASSVPRSVIKHQ
ncbi:MAG TPA: hypothetical protein VF098_12455 [Sphingomicrobium sp.]|jgi:hypothetical protein